MWATPVARLGSSAIPGGFSTRPSPQRHRAGTRTEPRPREEEERNLRGATQDPEKSTDNETQEERTAQDPETQDPERLTREEKEKDEREKDHGEEERRTDEGGRRAPGREGTEIRETDARGKRAKMKKENTETTRADRRAENASRLVFLPPGFVGRKRGWERGPYHSPLRLRSNGGGNGVGQKPARGKADRRTGEERTTRHLQEIN